MRPFAYFGGVPTRILYDNTKITVAKIPEVEKNGNRRELLQVTELLPVRR